MLYHSGKIFCVGKNTFPLPVFTDIEAVRVRIRRKIREIDMQTYCIAGAAFGPCKIGGNEILMKFPPVSLLLNQHQGHPVLYNILRPSEIPGTQHIQPGFFSFPVDCFGGLCHGKTDVARGGRFVNISVHL